MNYKEVTLDSFTVAGISVRTCNKDGKGLKDIGDLFHKFFSGQIAANIPNKLSEDIYCVYTDYESDFMGEYTTIIGCKVSDTKDIPEGLIIKHIPGCKYRIYQEQGIIHEAIGKIWTHIWTEGETINRAYIADFDIYGEEAKNPSDATVYTYLSVNS